MQLYTVRFKTIRNEVEFNKEGVKIADRTTYTSASISGLPLSTAKTYKHLEGWSIEAEHVEIRRPVRGERSEPSYRNERSEVRQHYKSKHKTKSPAPVDPHAAAASGSLAAALNARNP